MNIHGVNINKFKGVAVDILVYIYYQLEKSFDYFTKIFTNIRDPTNI